MTSASNGVSRKWFGDHGICLYHRISQRVGLAAKHDHRDVRRGGGRPEFGQHGQAGPLLPGGQL
jgi:hypothetical protein